jgi:hypothetical protein
MKPYLLPWDDFKKLVEQPESPDAQIEGMRVTHDRNQPMTYISRYSTRIPKGTLNMTTTPIYSSTNRDGFDAAQMQDIGKLP